VTAATLASIEIDPADETIAKGTTLPFTAVGTYSDGTTQDLTGQVTWTASDENVATIANDPGSEGLATGVDVGTATIFAARSGVTGATTLTVTNATLDSIAVTPVAATLPKGTTVAFVATATFSDGTAQDVTAQATWISTNTDVATVTNGPASHGVGRGIAAGTATISATLLGVTGGATLTVTDAVLVSMAVTPANPTIAKERTIAFTATGTYSDASTLDLTSQVTWSLSDAAVATISNASGSHGVAAGVGVGSATISAAMSGTIGSTLLTVNNAVLDSITLAPLAPALPKTFKLQFTATGHYSDGTTADMTPQVTWVSSNTTKATISNGAGSQGLASGLATGTTTISFFVKSFSNSTMLSVTAAKPQTTAITPSPLTLAVGRTQQMTAITTFDDGSTLDITLQKKWTSSHGDKVAVSNNTGSKGVITALKTGTSDISIQVGGAIQKGKITVP